MAYVNLGTKAVGSIVKIKVNGAVKDFIVVHQGKPSSVYDDSCNGTWLLMKDIYERRKWHSSDPNDYANSTIHSYLNSTFLNLLESNIKNAIKQVKLPYRKGSGTSTTVTSGSNGLPAKIFLLSASETSFNFSSMPSGEGAELAYFKGCVDDGSDSKRVAYLNGSATPWWLRSPDCNYYYNALGVNTNGIWYRNACFDSNGVRPALIFPSTLLVSGDGTVIANTSPYINASSTNLGEKNAPFDFRYTVTDADGDTLTVTEKLDGKTTNTRTGVASGTALTFGQGSTAENFQRILNGSHTIQITANDGKESTTLHATFTKSVTSASVTLTTPLAVDGDITVAVLQVTGSIPDDAKFKAEVTNNAKDTAPVWQDATTEVQKGVNIVFENKTATAGAAFNFRVSVERGASGEGGYIEAVSGAFE